MSGSGERGTREQSRKQQLALVRAQLRSSRPRTLAPAATEFPIARVAVDVPLPHLDRPFDYLVPEPLSAAAAPGVRVRVRFSGRLVDGYLLDRAADSGHSGRLARLTRVVSPEPVLTPEIVSVARRVADRYAGTLVDVLRLAVPSRHAAVEAEPVPVASRRPPAPDPGPWQRYPTGPAFLRALARRRSPRAAWSALPGPTWPIEIALAVQATLAGGRGALVVVPDTRDLARVDEALTQLLAPFVAQPGPTSHVALTAELGVAERYRRWLRVRRGAVRAVAGTRAAALAPVVDLGLVVLWDPGDDLHVEPRAPYPHMRDVLAIRAEEQGTALLLGGFSATAETASLLSTGWVRPLTASREQVRLTAPVIRVTGDDAELARDPAARTARLPSAAWRAAHDGLRAGPVLVQVPRRGYLPSLACERCRSPARCTTCRGPLSLSDRANPASCRWCGRPAARWRCPVCSGARFRAQVVGAGRTAEELGRAFPGVPVLRSGHGDVLASVPTEPALVVATPGAEPVVDGGYPAALLLDAWALLGRPDLRGGEEALRRWMGAAALVRPVGEGGSVVLVAGSTGATGSPVAQALVRWDPLTFAEREFAERAYLGFPPAVRLAALFGADVDVRELLTQLELPPSAEVLGPVPIAKTPDSRPASDGSEPPGVRALVRVPRAAGPELTAALKAAQGVRSARKSGGPVRVQVDPADVG